MLQNEVAALYPQINECLYSLFRAIWSGESTSIAVSAVQNCDLGFRDAPRVFDVPSATVERRLVGGNKLLLEALRKACNITIELKNRTSSA